MSRYNFSNVTIFFKQNFYNFVFNTIETVKLIIKITYKKS